MADPADSKFVLCRNEELGTEAVIARSALPWDGWEPVRPAPDGPTEAPALPADEGPVEPARNASAEDWRAYAVALGADPDAVADATRADLIDTYAQEA